MNYSTVQVGELLVGVWDPIRVLTAPNPYEPDPEMPKGPSVDPRRASDKACEIADVSRAWERAHLTTLQRQVLLLHFGMDYPLSLIDAHLKRRKGSAAQEVNHGLHTLAWFLNTGEREYPEIDPETEFDGDAWTW